MTQQPSQVNDGWSTEMLNTSPLMPDFVTYRTDGRHIQRMVGPYDSPEWIELTSDDLIIYNIGKMLARYQRIPG